MMEDGSHEIDGSDGRKVVTVMTATRKVTAVMAVMGVTNKHGSSSSCNDE